MLQSPAKAEAGAEKFFRLPFLSVSQARSLAPLSSLRLSLRKTRMMKQSRWIMTPGLMEA